MRIRPIVEYGAINPIEGEGGISIFDETLDPPYWREIVSSLKSRNGIYIFYDGYAAPIYFGVAPRQPIWKRANRTYSNLEFDAQRLIYVEHPGPEGKSRPDLVRPIQRVKPSIRLLAKYFSAYEVSREDIDGLEAFAIRAFGGSLFNSRLEGNGVVGLTFSEADE